MNKYSAIDLETKGLIREGVIPPILCVSMATDERKVCIPWGSDAINELNDVLTEHTPVFHNAAFDVRILRGVGVHVGDYIDTMVLSYVWNPTWEHKLESWGGRLEYPKLPKPWEGDYPESWDDNLKEYCLRDAELTLKVFYYLRELYKGDARAKTLVKTIENPFTDIIMEMEESGVYIDLDKLQDLSTQLLQEQSRIGGELTQVCPVVPNAVKKLLNPMKDTTGWVEDGTELTKDGRTQYRYKALEPFTASKSRHKAHLLKQFGWVPTEFTATGEPCVDKDVLETINHPSAKLLLEVSKINTIMSTFVEPFTNNNTKCSDSSSLAKLYGNFNQFVTVTGRLSSSKPNLQNIPRRGDLGKQMRSIFVAPPGYKLIDGDLSNIEARILAYVLWVVCGDNALVKVFQSGDDFHQANADRWSMSRDDAKTTLFSIIYGAGASLVAARTGKTLEEAKQTLAQVDESSPSIGDAKRRLIEKCRKDNGLLHTLYGRRLIYTGINSKDHKERTRCERQIFNAIIQGTSADILKILTLEAKPFMERQSFKIWLELHDEVLGMCKEEVSEETAAGLTKIFNSNLLAPVPIKADFRIGDSWNDAH